ncbi:cytochrome b2 [Setomelanomma holmii]|uniref:Cytochrome b2 n=1 Tax=Setomelanomma holmii TaxID=210430 RepID=A0A9P4H926_9PLEO|nr:cytochrome b2 [Setomelanomma holmii]
MTLNESLSFGHVKSHNSRESCWVVIQDRVWDVTDFLRAHPGGAEVILEYAGQDAKEIYEEIHASGMLEETLTSDRLIGNLLPSSNLAAKATKVETAVIHTAPDHHSPFTIPFAYQKPELYKLVFAADFEEVARKILTPKAWAFYSSAATDIVTHGMNKSLTRRVMFRPRILRDVKHVTMKRKILGCESPAPFFISPAAMARMAHPDGEVALAKAAGTESIIQCTSSNASYPLSTIVNAGRKNQSFFLQLYAASLGVKGIFVTVDAPVPGKREADERIAAENIASAISGAVASNDKKGGGMGRLMAAYVEKSLVWSDIAWIKHVSGLPVVLKGVQSAEDAMMAVRYGATSMFLSNHGGRSLDGAQASILVLLELHRICPEVFDQLEVYIDGGFERGSDILNAIALGATAVGIGRPYLYSLTYGQEGDELETSTRLSGVTDIDQAHPGLVNTRDVDHLIAADQEHAYIRWKPKTKG